MSNRSTKYYPSLTRSYLPPHAQKIFEIAYNHAWDEYQSSPKRQNDESLEKVAYQVAWDAVKNKYTKDLNSGRWIKKSDH